MILDIYGQRGSRTYSVGDGQCTVPTKCKGPNKYIDENVK